MENLFACLCTFFEKFAGAERAKYLRGLIGKLVYHELTVLSQRRYFTGEEYSCIKAAAEYTANLLILPPVTKEFDVLLEEIVLKGLIMGFFTDSAVRTSLVQICPQEERDEAIFRYSLERLSWEWRIYLRDFPKVDSCLRNNPTAYFTVGAVQTQEIEYIESLQEDLRKKTSWMELPEYKRIDKICDSVQDWLFKLMQMPVMERYKKSFLTELNVRRDLQNEYDRLTETEKGSFEAETQSLFEKVKTKNGNRALLLDIIPASTHTKEKVELTKSQKESLREFLSKTELRIWEAILNNPDATEEEIAQQAGCVQPTVSKTITKLKRHKEKIKEISEIS